MQERITLKAEEFELSLQFAVYESDLHLPVNTVLSVCVSSSGFSACSTMDIDIKGFADFCRDLSALYASLTGAAKITDYDGEQFIFFSADSLGNVHVSGTLKSNGESGFWQELKFENRIDQTYLSEFVKSLTAFCDKFTD